MLKARVVCLVYSHNTGTQNRSRSIKNDDNCSQCGHKDGCRLMYEKLGKATGKSVAMKAVVAFWVPIGVFIGTLAAGERLLQGQFEGRSLTSVSFLLAVCISLLVVLIIRAINGPVKKEHCKKG